MIRSLYIETESFGNCDVILFTTLRTSEFAISLCYVIMRPVIPFLLALYYSSNHGFQRSRSSNNSAFERKMQDENDSVLEQKFGSRTIRAEKKNNSDT